MLVYFFRTPLEPIKHPTLIVTVAFFADDVYLIRDVGRSAWTLGSRVWRTLIYHDFVYLSKLAEILVPLEYLEYLRSVGLWFSGVLSVCPNSISRDEFRFSTLINWVSKKDSEDRILQSFINILAEIGRNANFGKRNRDELEHVAIDFAIFSNSYSRPHPPVALADRPQTQDFFVQHEHSLDVYDSLWHVVSSVDPSAFFPPLACFSIDRETQKLLQLIETPGSRNFFTRENIQRKTNSFFLQFQIFLLPTDFSVSLKSLKYMDFWTKTPQRRSTQHIKINNKKK